MTTLGQHDSLEGQFVTFRIANEHYGLPIEAVKEIIVLDQVSRLPQMPDFIEGIVDLRGRIIPVVNLRKRFGLPPHSEQRPNRTVVAEIREIEVGLSVDEVIGVVRVAAAAVQPPPSMLQISTSFVSGVARVNDQLVILLDQNNVLQQREQELLRATN